MMASPTEHDAVNTVAAPAEPARWEQVLRTALAVVFLLCVGLNFTNVMGRYLLGRTVHGADELQIYALVGIAFLGAALVSARDQQLRMDLLAQRLPVAGQRALKIAEHALVAGIAGFVTWHSAAYTWQMAALDARSDDLRFPMWMPHSLVSIGFALVALIALGRLVGLLSPYRSRP